MESWMPRTRRSAGGEAGQCGPVYSMLPEGYDTMLTGDGEELSRASASF